MKKLLSILATLVIGASSASAVVACSTETPNSAFNYGNDNRGSSTTNKPAKQGDVAPDAIPTDNGKNKPSKNNGNDNKPSTGNDNKLDLATEDNIEKFSTKKILQDEYGIDGDYLDSVLGTKGIDKLGTAKGLKTGNYAGSQYPLIDFLVQVGAIDQKTGNTISNQVLPLLTGVDIPNPSGIAGQVSSLLPLLVPALKGTLNGLVKDPAAAKAKADKALNPEIGKIIVALAKAQDQGSFAMGKYDNLKVGDAMKSIMIGAAYILGDGTNDLASAAKFKDMTKTDSLDDAINYLIKRVTDLINSPKVSDVDTDDSKLADGTLILDGANFTDDMGNAGHYKLSRTVNGKDQDLAIVNLAKDNDKGTITLTLNKADLVDGSYELTYDPMVNDSTANAKIDITFDVANKTIQNDKVVSGSLLTFDITKLESRDSLDALVDMVQLFGMYIESFDSYKAGDSVLGIDNNHIFKDKDGNPLGNYEVINKVRNESIGSQNYKFNIIKLISNISYYLGKLDKQDGVYRLQAFLAMFLVDDDKSSASKFMMNWDNDGSGVTGWNQKLYGESANMTPLSKLINKFLGSFLSAQEPAGAAGIMSALGLDWNSFIVPCITHNVYIMLQSMAWNRGISFSDKAKIMAVVVSVKMNQIDTGFNVLKIINFPGLNVLDQWAGLEKDGLLSYLFTGNVYELLNEVVTNEKFDNFFNQLDGFSKGLKKKIVGGVQNLMTKIAPLTSQVPLSEKIDLTDKIGDYKKVVFETNGMKTVLNTDLDEKKLNNPEWTTYTGAYDAPTITKVVAGNYDSSANTTELYIYADGIYQTGKLGGKPNGMDDFAKTIKLNGKSISATRVGSDQMSGNDGYEYHVVYKATIDGKAATNMTVSGDAYRYLGKKKVHHGGSIIGWDSEDDQYGTETISNSVINIAWQQDDLKLADKYNFNFVTDAWKNANSLPDLSMADIQRLKGLTITGYKDDSDKGSNLISKIEPTMGKSLNMQSVAAWSITSLLKAAGIKGISDTGFALPIADNFTLGGAILELGNLVNPEVQDPKYPEDKNKKVNIADLLTDSLFLHNFTSLSNLIFGINNNGDKTAKGSITDRLIDAFSATSTSDMQAKLNDALGIIDTNTYSKDGLFGALMATFTPSLPGASDPQSDVVNGDVKKATPLWDYLTNTLGSAWKMANFNYDKNTIAMLDNQDNFTYDESQLSKDGTVTIHYTYTSTEYGWSKDNTYKLTVNKDKSFTIEKLS